MQRRTAVFTTLLALSAAAPAQNLTDWRINDTVSIFDDGSAISQPGYAANSWTPAVVPGTVLTSFVKAGKYPEPLYGLNNLQIPEALCRTSYWYRTEFVVPKSHQNRHTWIRFDGVNYMADVWVNGHSVGSIKGAFARGLFDVSRWVTPGSRAAVAVKILPPNHPGVPHEQTLAGGTGPNGGATGADGVTIAATVGWDWIPGIRDRDMGLWQPVTLFSTGDVTIHDPFVRTDLPLPRTDSATLSVSTTLRNETTQPQHGTLEGTIDGTHLRISVPVDLAAGETKTVSAPDLQMAKPRLWWPNGYGKPELYKLRLKWTANKAVSDTFETKFGVREMGYFRAGSPDLTVHVNGVPIMCRGGNWGIDEAMKRSPIERLDAQVRMHWDANCNMIRNWVGQSTQEDFYAVCDKYGILVWDDFWLANPSDGPVPVDNDLFLANAREKLLRYRNHPSIALWCGRNEAMPPPVLNDGLSALVRELDPTRFYQPHSAAVNNVGGGGPYGQVPFERYYQFTDGLHTEVGAPSIPTLESIKGMMPAKDWWPINDDWAYHDLTRGAQAGDRYASVLSKRYGPVAGFKDFVRKGSMLTYETYRAMFEGRNSKLFSPATGVLLWMSNPAQPSFVWQLYHYDLDPTAAMFGTKVANEPVHVQMLPSGDIQVVNTTPTAITNGQIEVSGFRDVEWPMPMGLIPVNAPASQVTTIRRPADTSYPPLMRLRLYAGKKLLSENVYWSVDRNDALFAQSLPPVHLTGEMRRGKQGLSVTLRNPSKTVSLLTHLSLRHADGSRVLPAFYSDNFIHIFPGESRTIQIEATGLGDAPMVMLDGWNLAGVSGNGLALNEDAKPEPPLPPAPPRAVLPGTLLSIDCGGADVPGSPWNPDDEFVSGGNNETQPGAVTGSDLPQTILGTERWGDCVYTIPLPAGKHRVRLVFAETSQPLIGGRKFHVDLNRRRVLTDFDIFAEAGGANKALVKEFEVEADRNGNLVIAFRKGSANEPEVRAIQVLP